MSVRLEWAPDPAGNGVTTYNIEKSTDKGVSWAVLDDVAYNVNGGSFDKPSRRFYYVDAEGNPGDIYRLNAQGTWGTSDWVFLIAPPGTQPLCQVFGYVDTAFAIQDVQTRIVVSAFMPNGRQWARNTQGLVSHNPEGLGILEGERVVYPDANGIWKVDVAQGVYCKVYIPALNFVWVFEVPRELGPRNIRDILAVRGADFDSVWGEQTGEPRTIINA